MAANFALGREESEWVFDFVMNLFKSPAWEVPIMTFIDENCAMFDSDEENKFCYTEIHEQFKDIVDGVLGQNLAEIGITSDEFAEICEMCRNSTEISVAVISQILAIDDFVTFKKLMVKRNMELELEAVRAMKEQKVPIIAPKDKTEVEKQFKQALRDTAKRKRSDDEDEDESMNDSEDEEYGAEVDASLKAAMDASLLEIDILHKQEEIEQVELEQAIALSIAMEEERLRLAAMEAKKTDDDDDLNCKPRDKADAKGTGSSKLLPLGSAQVLPLPEMEIQVSAMKKQAHETFMRNQQALKQQKMRKDDLHAQAEVTEEELKRREKYMREQRDAIIAKKKKEREDLLNQYMREQKETAPPEPPPQIINKVVQKSATDVAEAKDSEAEERRAALRIALARRMKQDLLECEEDRMTKKQAQQFMGLDEKLRQVEQIRKENQKKEELMFQEITQNQTKRVRNLKKSLKKGGYTEDDFGFAD